MSYYESFEPGCLGLSVGAISGSLWVLFNPPHEKDAILVILPTVAWSSAVIFGCFDMLVPPRFKFIVPIVGCISIFISSRRRH
jgi:hypothetical protein